MTFFKVCFLFSVKHLNVRANCSPYGIFVNNETQHKHLCDFCQDGGVSLRKTCQ